jgi:septal ring factor EnvC (AmiA/AmiB activator)
MASKLGYTLLLFFLGLCASMAAWAAGSAPSADAVHKQAEQAVTVRAQTQKKVEALASQEADLALAVETRTREIALITRQRKKTEAFLADQRQKLAEMQRRQKELARIKAELEPFLDQTYTRLSDFVQTDLPFLAKERTDRLSTLGGLLNDYDASLPQKTRRLLEALEIESRYGATAQSNEQEEDIAGRRLQVRTLRLGRLALFAISQDGTRSWKYNLESKSFDPVDGYSRELSQAADIAQRHRVATLVEVPLGVLTKKEAKP